MGFLEADASGVSQTIKLVDQFVSHRKDLSSEWAVAMPDAKRRRLLRDDVCSTR